MPLICQKEKQKNVLISLDTSLVEKIDTERKTIKITRKKFIEFAIIELLKNIKKEVKE